MSDLHWSLMIFGLVVIVGVVAYNWFQEQKFRKIAQQRFQAPSEDVLMTQREADAEIAPQTRTLDEVRIEPSLHPISTPSAETVAPIVEAPAAASPSSPVSNTGATRTEPSELPQPLDPAIDYVARLEFSEPMQAGAVRAAIGAALVGKAVHWLARSEQGHWEDLAQARERLELTALSGAIQLADRTGAITDDDLGAFVRQVRQVGETLSAVVQLPDRQAALETASKLDTFCADVDILVGVNVIALEQATFVGTKIRALAEAGGLRLADDGTYQYFDEHGAMLYSLGNQESAPFGGEQMKNLTTHGLTLLFDVPRIPNGLRAFDQMIGFARQITEALHGMMVDDNLRPLTDEGVSKIKQQLSMIYGKMDKYGVPAGSARARRLFS